MARTKLSGCCLALLMIYFGAGSETAASDDSFKVIVHPDNRVSAIDSEFLRSAFLKTAIRWSDDGTAIRPIELSEKHPARARFTQEVLGKTPAQRRNYWVQRIFSGTAVPPPDADSAAAAIAYVLANPGGLGYIPASVDAGLAKVVKVK
jgi:ABC-type phosphate transport system substrate-binding protein